MMWTKRFDPTGEPWGAHEAAARWLKERGYSLGTMQGQAPRGILRGRFLIAKWRNLTADDRGHLDGVLESSGRDAGVVVKLKVAPEVQAA